jgi:hypothetical protein
MKKSNTPDTLNNWAQLSVVTSLNYNYHTATAGHESPTAEEHLWQTQRIQLLPLRRHN